MASPSILPFVAPLPAEEDPATHASRNPTQHQQQPRVLTQVSLSLAQKATRSLRLLSDRAKAEELAAALDIVLSRHQTELEDFSKDHNTKMEYIQKLTSQSSHYTQKRAVTIQNAKMHAKSLEVNGGMCYTITIIKYTTFISVLKDLGIGERVKLKELRQLIEDDPAYQNLTIEEEDKLKEEVLEHRKQKKVGARPTNKSAAQDYRAQLTQMNNEARFQLISFSHS
jgi:hypothetical protein